MDYNQARMEFEQYLNDYDRTDGKVKLKITHTYGVVARSGQIAERMGLSAEDRELAKMIALLHDIGRFEQLKRYDSFLPETMDHAAYGADILFKGGLIRRFLEENTWDSIIEEAIRKHSDYILSGIEDQRTLLHARLIRDADKLDNCRVKLEDPLETFMNASAQEIGEQKITEKVRDDILKGKSILSSDRITDMDFWVSYLAYFYDLNFKESLEIVKENNYVGKIAGRIPYSNPETKATMRKISEELEKYIDGRVPGHRQRTPFAMASGRLPGNGQLTAWRCASCGTDQISLASGRHAAKRKER